MHCSQYHGHRFPPEIIRQAVWLYLRRDGETLPESARFLADTVNVGPGQRYDVVWIARRPGKWLVHCHIPHHTANNNVEEKGDLDDHGHRGRPVSLPHRIDPRRIRPSGHPGTREG